MRAQPFWAQGVGGNDVDETMDICSSSGDIISTGYFTNSVVFTPLITLTSASAGVPDIYISKSNSAGVIQWVVQAGGSGSDRALSVKADASGNIYVTGFYYGSATFGSITLTSVSGTQDIFIAKLNSSGNFIWAVSAGGTMADMGNAIDVDGNGNVLVTGQFQGTATFGTSVLTSMMNPQISLPSIDVFTARYNKNGNFLWVRQGKAKYTDRGLDIATDASGNVFVCGQFSDTILFSQVHNNPVMNAVFLIKYDSLGNEVWFRRASGTYSIAYSLVINSNQDIYMTGDYQGNLAFYGTPNNFLTDTYSKAVYIVKYSNSGSFIWAQSESSNNYISSRGVALDKNDDPYIAGEYGCTLSEYADIFGKGIFNSIGYQDIFSVKYNSSGARKWMRSFGGPGNDKAHGILVNAVDNPVIAGSYEKRILWPVDLLSVTTNNSATAYSGNTSYCSDPSYGNFSGMSCAGFSDGFVAQAVDISRQPYDYYHRTGSSCFRDFVGGCVDSLLTFSCPDTLTFCGVGYLYANTHTGSGFNSVGPDYNFLWSASAFGKTHYIDTIKTTNYYSVKMSTVDGCYSSEDTVYAIVNPIPQAPTITDDHGINIQQPQWGKAIVVCKPDTVLLVAGNLNGNAFQWYNGSGVPLGNNDSIYTYLTDLYTIVLTNKYGCTNFNYVPVEFDSLLSPLHPVSHIPDTIVACYGDDIKLDVVDSFTSASGPFYSFMNTWTSNPSLLISSSASYLFGEFSAQTSGTYIVHENIVYINHCDTLHYSVQDTFYLLVHPKPTITVSMTGPGYMCQGDTVILQITYTPSTSLNTMIVKNPQVDSIIVTQAGSYGAFATITDTITGCYSGAGASLQIQIFPDPVIITNPLSGLICPNDSVLISCNTVGINYQWIGPTGILPFNTQSIYQNIPGFYHCIVTNTAGCVLTSNTVELKQYNTPYLLPTPSNIVCLGQSVTLQVITNDTTLIHWNSPLSGGGTTQVVNQTGVYSCDVTMCGITTHCSITVVVSQAIAQIFGPAIVCPGDSILLTANSGMAGYQWTPITSFNASVYVHAGAYSLITTDANGCTAVASAIVALDTSVSKPSAKDTTVCAGSVAILHASGIGQVEWYTSLTSNSSIYTGNSFTTPPINIQTTYYVATSNIAGCHSLRDSATVFITTTSLPPFISVTDTICGGGNILLSTPFQQNATYSWTGPNGFASSLQNVGIANASAVNSGVYILVVSGNGCTSPPVSDTVVVVIAPTPMLTGVDTVCAGDSILLIVTNPWPNTTYYWNGPLGFSSTGDSVILSQANASNAGTYSVYGSIHGCVSIISSFDVFVKPGGPSVIASSNSPICSGDTLRLFSNGGNVYSWIGPAGFSSNTQNPVIFPSGIANSGTYSVAAALNGCSGYPYFLSVQVNPLPTLDLGLDTVICKNQPWLLAPTGNFSSYFWYDSTIGSSHVIDSTGLYFVTVTNGYGCKVTDSIKVLSINCETTVTNIFTPNGDGINDLFTFSGRGYKKVQCVIFDRWGRKIYGWNDPDGGWDGMDIRAKYPVSEGTYYYVATVIGYDEKEGAMKGFLSLVR